MAFIARKLKCRVCQKDSGMWPFCKDHKPAKKAIVESIEYDPVALEKKVLENTESNKEIDSPLPVKTPPLKDKIIQGKIAKTKEEWQQQERELALMWNDLPMPVFDTLLKIWQSNKFKSLIATARKVGKSYWALGMCLQAILNHPEANFLYNLKFGNRHKIQTIPILKMIIGDWRNKDMISNRTYEKLMDCFIMEGFRYNGQMIYWASLENSSRAYVPSTLTRNITPKFWMLIFDEICFESEKNLKENMSPEEQTTKIKESYDNTKRGQQSEISPLSQLMLFNSWDTSNHLVFEIAEKCNVNYDAQNNNEYKLAIQELMSTGYIYKEEEMANYFVGSYKCIPDYRFDQKDFDYEYKNYIERWYVVYLGVPMRVVSDELMTYYTLKNKPIPIGEEPKKYEIYAGIDGGANSYKNDQSMLVLAKFYYVDNLPYVYIWKVIIPPKENKKMSPSEQAKYFYDEVDKIKEPITFYCDPRAWWLLAELQKINTRTNFGFHEALLDNYWKLIYNRTDWTNAMIQQNRFTSSSEPQVAAEVKYLSQIENYNYNHPSKAGERNETKRQRLEFINCIEMFLSRLYYMFGRT